MILRGRWSKAKPFSGFSGSERIRPAPEHSHMQHQWYSYCEPHHYTPLGPRLRRRVVAPYRPTSPRAWAWDVAALLGRGPRRAAAPCRTEELPLFRRPAPRDLPHVSHRSARPRAPRSTCSQKAATPCQCCAGRRCSFRHGSSPAVITQVLVCGPRMDVCRAASPGCVALVVGDALRGADGNGRSRCSCPQLSGLDLARN